MHWRACAQTGSATRTHSRRSTMRFYQTQHPFYCGVDLHTKSLHVCIVDQAGSVLVHRNLPANPQLFLQVLAPYQEQGVAVAAECMFAWYWLADLCTQHGIP